VSNLKIKAKIKWQKKIDSAAMEEHLKPYKTKKQTTIKRLYGGVIPEQIGKTQISIKCGTSPETSYFIFIEGAGNTSQIVGASPSNRLDHLLNDFDHLIDQMHLLGVNFKLHDIQIQINDESLVKKSFWNYFYKRSVLVDLITMAGFIPLVSAYILNVLTLELVYPIIIGFIFWFATSIIGYRSESEYALK